MELLDGLRETWNHPNMRHAAMVHLPVALSIIGLLAALVAALATGCKTLRWSAIVLYLLMAGAAWMATQSGETAENALAADLATPARDLIHEHEELGEYVWLFALGTALLLAIAIVPRRAVRLPAAWLGVLAALFTAGWVADTARHGGEAVYQYAAGTSGSLSDPAAQRSDGSAGDPATGGADASADPRAVYFRESVLPIIQTRCMRCHDPVKQKGGLDQTTLASILKGGRSGPVIVPGKPEVSLLFLKITHPDDGEVMPPGGERLTPEQIAAIEQWIRDGAAG